MARATIEKPSRIATTKPETRQFRTFRSAVNYLDSLTNYERALRTPYDTANFGVARTSRLLAALGNPQRNYRSVHIAGTKGKGSTAAMVAELLRGCGHKVGLYTSPHLLNIRERIAVDSQKISELSFAKVVSTVVDVTSKARVPKPTYFEILTVAAFQFFAEEEIDIAVIETGLGGELDSTNVLKPDVIGITSISHDHFAQLGTDIADIARAKAGVFKNGVPIISAPQTDVVRAVLEEAANTAESSLRFANEGVDFSYRFEYSRSSGHHARICMTTQNSRFEHLQVPVFGGHQATNCCVALGIIDTLKGCGVSIDDQQAMIGLSKVSLPGRMQIVSEEPRILVDGAHNAASVDALMRAIGQHIAYDSMVVIFACHKDKDISGMIRRLQIGADKIIFTSTGTPRSADPAELAAQYIENSGKMAQVGKTLDDALRIATGAISREDIICITGSFYLVAKAMKKFGIKIP